MTTTGRVADEERDDALPELLDYLKASRGFDFSGYKRASLERRIRKRMGEVGFDDYGDYQDFLEVHPDEFTDLFNTILINVTDFFRDKPAWDFIASDVLPQLLETTSEQDPIRVWSAACASGEEAYTIAMLLAEQMGEEQFRERVKIYATDVDEEALTQARQAIYSRDQLKQVPRELVERYFDSNALGYRFRSEFRRSVIFGRNDIVQDAPISRVDLLVSRNALMYFTPETQARILEHFNFSLKDTGFLFLGKAEMLITHTDLFKPHSVRWRVFTKVARANLRDRLAFTGTGMDPRDRDGASGHPQLRDGAWDQSPVAQVVVDRDGYIGAVNTRARLLFNLGVADLGRPLQDLELSYRPVELRSLIEQVHTTREPMRLGRTPWNPEPGEERVLQVELAPLFDSAEGLLGTLVNFEDVTSLAKLDDDHAQAQRELEQAYEELQSTVEELETTNEELQSTNEELETTNEELQSTNEELETMNEELQSTNDAFETINDEQRTRAAELDRANALLEGILGSLGVAIVVLDPDLRIETWNADSENLWGVRPAEAEGEHLFSLDIGLPTEQLKAPIKSVLTGESPKQELVLPAVNRRGREIECEVKLEPLLSTTGSIRGLIALMRAL